MSDRNSRRRLLTPDIFDQYRRHNLVAEVNEIKPKDGIRPDTGVWVRDTTHDIDHPLRRSASPSRSPRHIIPDIQVREGTPLPPERYTPDSEDRKSTEREKYSPVFSRQTSDDDFFNPEQQKHTLPRERKLTFDKTTYRKDSPEFTSEKAKHEPENDDIFKEKAKHYLRGKNEPIPEKARRQSDGRLYTPEKTKNKPDSSKKSPEDAKQKPADNGFKPEPESRKNKTPAKNLFEEEKIKDNKRTDSDTEEENPQSTKNNQDGNRRASSSKVSRRPNTSKYRLDQSTFGPYSYMKSTKHTGDNSPEDPVHEGKVHKYDSEDQPSRPPSSSADNGRRSSSPVFKHKSPPPRTRPPSGPVHGSSPVPSPAAVTKENRKRDYVSDSESILGDLPPKRTPLNRRDSRGFHKKDFGVRRGSYPRSESTSKDRTSRVSIHSPKENRSTVPKRVTSRVEKATHRINRSRLSKSSTLSISYNHNDIVDDNLLISASKLDNTLLRLFSNTRDPRDKKLEGEDDLIPYLNYSESDLISMEPVRWKVFPMEAAHKETLEQEMTYIEDNVQPQGVIKTLYDDDVLTHMDFTQFSRTEGQGERAVARLLVKTLQRRGNKAFPAFVGALRTNDYPHVSDRLEETERAIRMGMIEDEQLKSRTSGAYHIKPTPPPPKTATPYTFHYTPVQADDKIDPLVHYQRLGGQPQEERPASEMLVIDSKDLEKHLTELSRELKAIQEDVDELRNPKKRQDIKEVKPASPPDNKQRASPKVQYVNDQPDHPAPKSSTCTVL